MVNEVAEYSAYLQGDVYECGIRFWEGQQLSKDRIRCMNGRPVCLNYKSGACVWGIVDVPYKDAPDSQCSVHSWQSGKERADCFNTLGVEWDAYLYEPDPHTNLPEFHIKDGKGFSKAKFSECFYGMDSDKIAEFIADCITNEAAVNDNFRLSEGA